VQVIKLLSSDPANYPDAPTEGIRRILRIVYNSLSSAESDKYDEELKRGQKITTRKIGAYKSVGSAMGAQLIERCFARLHSVVHHGRYQCSLGKERREAWSRHHQGFQGDSSASVLFMHA
jgi:hypothetical protein